MDGGQLKQSPDPQKLSAGLLQDCDVVFWGICGGGGGGVGGVMERDDCEMPMQKR